MSNGPKPSQNITQLATSIAVLPPDLYAVAKRLLWVETAVGRLVPPESMRPWIEQRFGSVDTVQTQTIIKVTNRFTLEAAIFNPIRAQRPLGATSDDTMLERWITQELEDDIFYAPERDTPADMFGRIRGTHCITASNIAKYDGWHGVVIFNEPHPLHFSQEQLRDYLATAWRWLLAAHQRDQKAIYPFISWNCLPKSGASLVHGHMQVALAQNMPYVQVERWRRAAADYRAASVSAYFDDLYALHNDLGLALPPVGGVRRFAHLTPLRNREIVLTQLPTAQNPWPTTDPTLLVAFADALYTTIRMLMEHHNLRSFNVGIALPPLAEDGLDWQDFPILARIGDRGDALSNRSDVGVMEFYGTPCITADPFELTKDLATK